LTPRTSLQCYAVVVAIASLAGLSAPLSAQQQPPPKFRTGVDLTRVEIMVLHKDTRKPIKGLRPEDFVIKVDGDVQRVATLAEVAVALPGEAPAPGIVEAAHDVAVNDLRSPRLFVIVMNDGGSGTAFDRKTGIAIAHRLIDGLGPEDKAAVVFVIDNSHAQDLTSDRTLLRRAVERFNPLGGPIDGFSVLRRAHDFLRSETVGYRRALIFISPLASGRTSPFGSNLFGIDEDLEAHARNLRAISTSSRIGHVPIYMFSTHGLHAPTAEDMRVGRGRNDSYENHLETFRTIANLTGGRTIAANNAPVEVVPAVLEELSSFYTLAYENTYPIDGRYRWLDVQVKHPDAMVMPSRVLIKTAKASSDVKASAVLNPGRSSGLTEALGAPLPVGEVPLRLTSVPLAVASKREQALALTLGLPRVPPGASDQFTVRLMVFDGEGRSEILGETHEVRITGDAAAADWNEIALRLNLRPGRYQMRIAAERASTKTSGSVHATVIVPDFADAVLSLSGVAIGTAVGADIGGREALADVLPFAPTVDRTFSTTDRVGALLRVHQSRRRPAQPVVLDTEIIDASGVVVRTDSRTIQPAAFADAGVEHRFELPLAQLTPGDYLLRFAASAGEAHVQRDVRFSIR